MATLPRRVLLVVVAALMAVTRAAGPVAAKAEAKHMHCVVAKVGGVVAKVCGKHATVKASGARTHR
jgi:hypothetical protein